MRALGVGVAVVAVAAVMLASAGTDTGYPTISYRDGTPGDVMALGDSTFSDFLQAFPAQQHCVADVEVAHNWDLGPEAGRYRANFIEIEVPNTTAAIRGTYLHEFGHHLDFNCADAELRAAFMGALGLDPGTDWHSDNRPWAQRPAERFAEAVVVIVGGSSVHPEISLTPESIRIVSSWAR